MKANKQCDGEKTLTLGWVATGLVHSTWSYTTLKGEIDLRMKWGHLEIPSNRGEGGGGGG